MTDITLTLTLLNKLSSDWIVVCFTLNFYQFTWNLEDILAEWQTAWNLTRRRVTRRLIWFQTFCKGLTIMISRLKVNRKIQWSIQDINFLILRLLIFTMHGIQSQSSKTIQCHYFQFFVWSFFYADFNICLFISRRTVHLTSFLE